MFYLRTLIFIALFFLFSTTAFAQDSTAAIHFVYGSDTSAPQINLFDKSSFKHNSSFELFASPTQNAYKVMDQSYRDQFKDSYGRSLPMTWWMQGGSLYRYVTNNNIPLASTMSIHLMQKYHEDKVEALGDEMTFHYHTWEWSDVNGDGRFYWNQTDDFNKVKDDFMLTLAEHLLEENMFPVSFRSGWHYMDNAWQATLNKWIPFSLHNNSPFDTNPTVEPIGNLIHWGHATLDFVPFQPSDEDYQVGGGDKGWNTRSRYFLRLTEDEVRRIFEQAKAGTTQVAAIWGHLAADGFLDNMEVSLELIAEVAEDYPDVPFHFSTAIEAMQDFIGGGDTTAPEIDIETTESGDDLHIQISSNEPLFQETPFLATKNVYEQYHIVPMEETAPQTWETIDPIDKSILAKWGFAVTDTVGNQTKELFNVLPDDVYIDNVDEGFSTSGSGWQPISFTSVNYIWGRDFQQINMQNIDSVSASWSATFSEDSRQQVFIRIPDYENPVNSIKASVYANDVILSQKFLQDLPPNKWLYVDDLQVLSGQKITTKLTAYNSNGENVNFGADVVKYSPLIRERQLQVAIGNFDFGQSVKGESIEISLDLTNSGSQKLQVQDVYSKSELISVSSNLPFEVPSYDTKTISFTLNSEIAQLINDTLYFESNDPSSPIIARNFTVEFKNYYRIVDDADNANYSEVGDWNYSVTEAYGETSRYISIQTPGSPTATFQTNVEQSGYYDVSFIIPEATNSAERADYNVYLNNELVEAHRINQNIVGGNWASLDMYYFEADDEVSLKVSLPDKNQQGDVLRADAFKVEFIGEDLNEALIDNESDLYSEDGPWHTSSVEAYGNTSRYASNNAEASATFKYPATETSSHLISMIVPETENASLRAQYSINQNSRGRGTVIMNQNQNSGSWRTLGAWSFQEGDTISVVITNIGEGAVLRADAIKIQYGVPIQVSNESNLENPRSFSLSQNYPNPFNPTTQIEYAVPNKSRVSLKVYNVLGELVATLTDEIHVSGTYKKTFNGARLASGIYYYRLKSADYSETKSFTLIK